MKRLKIQTLCAECYTEIKKPIYKQIFINKCRLLTVTWGRMTPVTTVLSFFKLYTSPGTLSGTYFALSPSLSLPDEKKKNNCVATAVAAG